MSTIAVHAIQQDVTLHWTKNPTFDWQLGLEGLKWVPASVLEECKANFAWLSTNVKISTGKRKPQPPGFSNSDIDPGAPKILRAPVERGCTSGAGHARAGILPPAPRTHQPNNEPSPLSKIDPGDFTYAEKSELTRTTLLPTLGSSAAPIILDDTDSEEYTSDVEREENTDNIIPSNARPLEATHVHPSEQETKQDVQSTHLSKLKPEPEADGKNSSVFGWVAAHARLKAEYPPQGEKKRNTRLTAHTKLEHTSPPPEPDEQLSQSASEREDDLEAAGMQLRPHRSIKKSGGIGFAKERRANKFDPKLHVRNDPKCARCQLITRLHPQSRDCFISKRDQSSRLKTCVPCVKSHLRCDLLS
ncbi:hypothetical protein HYPSUDRAFT_410158 [Hypholoma sublateritium FD-334 SS-4]|uniref:Uncharacterized protein n=1 Tax=Hypholoma sublateritium (strain FD-334 SS-4) TaxID=945553 RepID=A0A0D2MP05_HYPSF|nr:hypothetical protein HYPSUDRAFT_410158 [Hypholoma sublateritium FD-334 SS-4]